MAAGIGVGAAAVVALACVLSEPPPSRPPERKPVHAPVQPPEAPEVRSALNEIERLRTLRSERRIPMSGVGNPEFQAALDRLRAAAPRSLHYYEQIVLDRREEPALRVDLLNLVAGERGEETRLFLASRVSDASEADAVRLAALEALMSYRDAATFEVFRRSYLDPAPFAGRYHLCRALGQSGRAEAVPLLKDALAPNQPLDLRCHAAEGLGGFPADPDARMELQRAALTDPASRVRQEAVRALSRSPQAERLLVDLLSRELDPSIRALVGELLAERGRSP